MHAQRISRPGRAGGLERRWAPANPAGQPRAAVQMKCKSSTVSAGGSSELQSSGEAHLGRRSSFAALLAAAGAATAFVVPSAAGAITGNPLAFKKELAKRRRKIPESEYTDGPEGLKYYDLGVGEGAEAKVGMRIAVHYDVKFRNVTMFTSRQGVGVTGGEPFGFNVGQPAGEPGSTLPGVDLGVRGMRVGGLRKLLVPSELGYGPRGMGEIPGGATLDVTVELLSIKTSPLGFQTKLIEG